MNITYECQIKKTQMDISQKINGVNDADSTIKIIQDHIRDLEQEQETIRRIYMKLSQFLQINAIHPCKDNILDYLKLIRREEKIKENESIANSLDRILTDYQTGIDALKSRLAKEDRASSVDILSSEDVFFEFGALSRLSINGKIFREQVDQVKAYEERGIKEREKFVKIPKKNPPSRLMPVTMYDEQSTQF